MAFLFANREVVIMAYLLPSKIFFFIFFWAPFSWCCHFVFVSFSNPFFPLIEKTLFRPQVESVFSLFSSIWLFLPTERIFSKRPVVIMADHRPAVIMDNISSCRSSPVRFSKHFHYIFLLNLPFFSFTFLRGLKAHFLLFPIHFPDQHFPSPP